jgi:hypothetical protein
MQILSSLGTEKISISFAVFTLHNDALMDLIQYDTKRHDFPRIVFSIHLKTIFLKFCDFWRRIEKFLRLCVQLIGLHFDIFQKVIKSTPNLTEKIRIRL